ncbi:MAG: phosphate/phosphite/phosphonate ABC transporter substrate-binding protein [Myxococcaceae bacterium]
MLRTLCVALCLLAVPALAEDSFTFGIAQPYGPEAADQVAPVLEPYLGKALKAKVKVVKFATAEELADALGTGKVDLAWITPLAFVRATQKNSGVTALSKAMRQGGVFYRAVFFTKAGSALTTLQALQGKKVAFVSKTSTSGYLFAREMLSKEGLKPDGFFSKEEFLGDHPAICKAVKDGTVDVGATFANEPAEGKTVQVDACATPGDFAVVASTGNVPNEVIAARDFFPPTRVNDVIAAFGRMDGSPEGKKVLEAFRADGWGVAVEGDFTQVADLLKPKAATPAKDEPKKKDSPKKGKK